MKTKTLAEVRAKRSGVDQASIDAEKDVLRAEVALHELREAAGITQSTMAERLDVSRVRVHKIEHAGEDLRLSTMERYVQALGGRLELRVVFDDQPAVILDRSA
jgi:DNA-binding XRE family transcriptional regulator